MVTRSLSNTQSRLAYAGFGSPPMRPGLSLWLDPYDLQTFDFLWALDFDQFSSNNANTSYLSFAAGGVANWQFNDTGGGVTKFTVSFWRNWNADHGVVNNTLGLDAHYIGQYLYGTEASWALKGGGSSGQGHVPQLWIAASGTPTGDSNIIVSMVTVATAPVEWSHCMFVYDGSQGTANNRARWYLDGELVASTTTAGTLPAQVRNSTAPLRIGGDLGVGSGSYLKGPRAALANVGVWKGVAGDADMALALYNSGVPMKYSAMGSSQQTGVVGFWNLDRETAGDHEDSSGNGYTMVAQGAAINPVRLVKAWRDKSPNRFVFRANRFGTGPTNTSDFCAMPRYVAPAIGKSPGLLFKFYSTLYCATSQVFNGAADFIETIRVNLLAGTEFFHLLSADQATDTLYCMTGLTDVNSNGEFYPTMRLRVTGLDGHIYALGSRSRMVINTNYVTNWQLYGSGGAASARFRLNGVTGPQLDYGGGGGLDAINKTWANAPGRDNLCLAGLRRSDGMSVGNYNFYQGEKLVYKAPLSKQENILAEKWVADRAGILSAA